MQYSFRWSQAAKPRGLGPVVRRTVRCDRTRNCLGHSAVSAAFERRRDSTESERNLVSRMARLRRRDRSASSGRSSREKLHPSLAASSRFASDTVLQSKCAAHLSVFRQRGLTTSLKRRANSAPSGPRGGTSFILHRAGLSSHCRLPLSSNVRRLSALPKLSPHCFHAAT
jgi:hypothetical protein